MWLHDDDDNDLCVCVCVCVCMCVSVSVNCHRDAIEHHTMMRQDWSACARSANWTLLFKPLVHFHQEQLN